MKLSIHSSMLDNDGALLKGLTYAAFSALVAVVALAPRYIPRVIEPAIPMATAMQLKPKLVVPRIHALPQSKVLPLPAQPLLPPMGNIAQSKPVPIPEGGGVLRKIAFASNRADGRHLQLYIMDANGLNLERLTESQAFDRDPHFSYDGTQIAFASNRTQTYQIYVCDLATRAVRQITQGGADKTNPFWSPDNRRLLFTLHHNGSSEVGIMNADGSDMHQLTQGGGDSHGYGFATDGGQVSFESNRNNRHEIYVCDLATRETTPLIETDERVYRGDPVFSPLGRKLVFSSNALDHEVRQLYIYDLDWKKYYRITNDGMDKDDPLFSPDGTKIAYAAKWENAWNIFIADADGKHARNLTRSYYDNLVPSWR